MLAMLVLNVASTLQMICRREAVNATQPTPTDLPRAKTDTQHQESTPAAKHRSPTALILRDRTYNVRTAELSRAIVSKDEGVLTVNSHKLAQHREPHHNAHPSLRSSRRKSGPRASRVVLATGLPKQPWIPAFAGTSGDLITSSNKNAAA